MVVQMKRKLLWQAFFYSALLVLICSACGNSPTTQTNIQSTPSAAAISPIATATVIPSPQAGVILVSSDKTSADWQKQLTDILSGLAKSSGLTFETRIGLNPSDVQQNTTKVVVFADAPANLNDLTAAATQTQFVLFGQAVNNPPANLTTISENSAGRAFLAGYIATLIAPDWRSAGLLPSDDPNGALEQQAFLNGGHYFCGRCVPFFAPIVLFPVLAAQPANTPVETWEASFTDLQKKVIQVVYVDPQVTSPELLQFLADQKMTLLGGLSPQDTVRPSWAATLQVDPAASLKLAWPDLISGKGGKNLEVAVSISDTSDELFSPGKRRLADQVLADLAAGFINPLNPPMQ
jgi:hypothetical protein